MASDREAVLKEIDNIVDNIIDDLLVKSYGDKYIIPKITIHLCDKSSKKCDSIKFVKHPVGFYSKDEAKSVVTKIILDSYSSKEAEESLSISFNNKQIDIAW